MAESQALTDAQGCIEMLTLQSHSACGEELEARNEPISPAMSEGKRCKATIKMGDFLTSFNHARLSDSPADPVICISGFPEENPPHERDQSLNKCTDGPNQHWPGDLSHPHTARVRGESREIEHPPW